MFESRSIGSDDRRVAGTARRLSIAPALIVLALTASMSASTLQQSFHRYERFQLGWSWDLAYYNQWAWTLTQGDGLLTVRPIANFAVEGPPAWKMNYLSPLRYLILPWYSFWSDPRLLLVVQAVGFWMIIPAAFTLARSELGSDYEALWPTALMTLIPILEPLAVNDFREIQIGMPGVLWAIAGYRSRHVGLTGLGIIWMLCCRQEYALVVASLAVLGPRDGELIATTFRWRRLVLAVGILWVLIFLIYVRLVINRTAAQTYLEDFRGPHAGLLPTVSNTVEVLLMGLGSWTALTLLAPRVCLMASPWIWSICGGKWAMRMLGEASWHHVRYVAPMTAILIGAGICGYALVARRLRTIHRGWIILVILWLLAALGLDDASQQLERIWQEAPHPITAREAEEIWTWIEQVPPEAGVMAAFEVTAPLSSRAELYSYIVSVNKPLGFPILPESVTWAFVEPDRYPIETLEDQGFARVHRGPFLAIYRR